MSAQPSFLNLPERLKLGTEQWNFLLRQLLYDLRVAIPGIIQSFDATKQTVTVQPALRENINIDLVPTPVQLPLLVDVPILLPRAGAFSLTFPIKQGDECLLIFADMCIDAWWQSSGVQNQIAKRRHDLSDAFALLGCWSQPRVISSYNASAAELRTDDGTVKITIKSNEIDIVAPTVNIEGSTLTVSDSTVTFDHDVTINGRDFMAHQHTGVSTGGGNSGPVL